MSLIPYGLNPDETWELDFAAARAEAQVKELLAVAARLRTEGKEEPAAKLDESRVELEAELAAYVRGTGPIFIVGPIPNGMRAEIGGEAVEMSGVDGVAYARRDIAWSEKVIRWAVRGHRNLRSRGGAEVPFVPEEIEWDGRKRTVVGRATLEAYQPILGDLALACLRSQRLDEVGKNA